MARPQAHPEDMVIETWEITTDGTVWVSTYDRREDRYTKTRVGGLSGSRKLHISRDDRKFNQEQVVEEMADGDPFTNGTLRLIDSANRDENLEARYHLTDAQLVAMFETRDDAEFRASVEAISSQLILRRLLALAEHSATVAQRDTLAEIIDERYKVGGTQRTVGEMIAAGERLQG